MHTPSPYTDVVRLSFYTGGIMGILSRAAVSAADFIQSPILNRTLATFTSTSYVFMDVYGGNLALMSSASAAPSDAYAPQPIVARVNQTPGKITSIVLLEPSVENPLPLKEDLRLDSWQAYACQFESGVVDHIYLKLRNTKTAYLAAGILEAIWPVLREDCLKEVASPEAKAAVSALLWTISKKIDGAVLVLNAAGQVLHVNAAGCDMLKVGAVLRETSTGLACKTAQQTRAFAKAIKACLIEPQSKDTEFILFLNSPDGMGKMPVSLSRHQAARNAMPLVVAIIPQQPDRSRIEMLAIKMGLTPSEARVAGLMQQGLTNRQAAQIAGLKEQTFSTYSKRVLAKLNVGCRAEMAHMLTWQASMGRAS